MSGPAQHARIAFSSLARTVQCPGSVALCEKYPDPPTEEADEGTLAHEVACKAAQGEGATPGDWVYRDDKGVHTVPPDMQRGAELWADHVHKAGGGLLEIPTQAIAIHKTECWGTPDFRAYDPVANVVRAGDYKYGFELVEAIGNYQLVAAAIATVDELQLSPAVRDAMTCELTIVQPRGYHDGGPVRTWKPALRDLMHYVHQARAAAFEALSPIARLRRGPECKYCPARHVCYELQNHGYAAADYSHRNQPNQLNPDALGVELAMVEDTIELLKARHSGLLAQAEHEVRAGHTVSGYGMKPGRSNLAWNDPGTALALYPQLAKTAEPITPAQARDRKLLSPEMVEALATRPPAPLKLTRINATKVFAR